MAVVMDKIKVSMNHQQVEYRKSSTLQSRPLVTKIFFKQMEGRRWSKLEKTTFNKVYTRLKTFSINFLMDQFSVLTTCNKSLITNCDNQCSSGGRYSSKGSTDEQKHILILFLLRERQLRSYRFTFSFLFFFTFITLLLKSSDFSNFACIS